MALCITRGEIEIDHRRLARRKPRAQILHADRGRRGRLEAEHARAMRTVLPVAVGLRRHQHGDVCQPICFSQDAVMLARTPLSSTSTTRAPQVAT